MENNNNYLCIQQLSSELFTAEKRRAVSIIDVIFRDNRKLMPNHGDGFSFAGDVYRPSDAPTRGKLVYTPLHISLDPRIREYMSDQAQVSQDKRLMEQTFLMLLSPCKTYQDVRDALPDCLQDALSQISSYMRERPEAYTIQGNERAMRQYEKILPRIEFYSAVRLIY